MSFAAGLLIALASIAAFPSAQAETTAAERLTLTAQVWGLAKYRHPAVTACQRNWDQVLVNALPGIEATHDDAQFDQAIKSLIAQAGAINGQTPDAQTPSWIRQAPFSDATKASLAAIAANRPTRQCYVAAGGVGRANFAADSGYNFAPLDRNTRLLGAFRYWNAVEYFFAYKALIGRDWADVLTEFSAEIADAPNLGTYATVMRRFTAEINDSHGYFYSGFMPRSSPPFEFAFVENKIVVSAVASPSVGNIRVGDVISAVNGESIDSALVRLDPYAHGSNPAWRRRTALQMVLGGEYSPYTYRLERADGSQVHTELTPGQVRPHALRAGIVGWLPVPASAGRSCSAGILTVDRYLSSQLSAIRSALASLDLLVIDARIYPSDAYLDDLFNNKFPTRSSYLECSSPDFKNLGSYQRQNLSYDSSVTFGGRIIVVTNEDTLSAGEFQTMLFQHRANTLVVGSQTAGADGDILLNLSLPGGIQTIFSSNRVAYADGRQSQRVGIVPDLHVTPTVAGLRSGRDEALEAALDCRWKTQSPAPRRPRPGLYFAADRDGEGLEIHQLGEVYSLFSYAYDADGLPQWSYANSSIADGTTNAPTFLGVADGADQNIGNLKLDFQRGPYQPVCAIADQSQTAGRSTLEWPIAHPSMSLCMQPLFHGDSSPWSGLWAGPDNELGWGLSLHHNGQTLVVLLYAFDGQGKPRWLIGSTDWNGASAVDIPMLRATGFCNDCAATPTQFESAGNIRLNLTQNSPGISTGNSVTVDVRFHDQSRWQRTDMPLRKF